jgi:hypothetical protein
MNTHEVSEDCNSGNLLHSPQQRIFGLLINYKVELVDIFTQLIAKMFNV